MASDPFRATELAPPALPRKPELPPIALGFTPTKWRKPRTGEAKLRVQFRNGYVDDKHTYRASDLRWTDEGSAWDIIAVRKA